MKEKYSQYKDKESRKLYNKEYQREYMRKWRERNADAQKNIDKRYRDKLRLSVLEHLGGAFCVECGCDIIEILEINHINGGGRKEMSTLKKGEYIRKIRDDINARDKYNVLCRVCNAKHYAEEILGIKGFTISWNNNPL